jgi:predicted anti-sigma-YlaC factor YlaD
MAGCDEIHELISAYVEGDLDAASAARVARHVGGCADCAELAETVADIVAAGAALSELEPPPQLAADIGAAPCRRWLGLLYRAVDREISDANLSRLLTHLESCPSCRRSWNDLALIHQIGDAMTPPPGLLERCVAIRRRAVERRVIGRRTATAAAYVLAVLTSLVIGNPVTLARNQAADAVQRVASSVSQEVNDVAADGRGEARVVVWRAWRFLERQATLVRDALHLSDSKDRSTAPAEKGAAHDAHEGEPR